MGTGSVHFAIQEGHIRAVDNVKVKRSDIVDVAKRALELQQGGEGVSFEQLYHIRHAFKGRYKRSPILKFFHRLFGSGKKIEQQLAAQLTERFQTACDLAKKGELSYEEGRDILHTLVNDHPVFQRLSVQKKENISTFLTVRLLNEREEFSEVIQDLARGSLSSFLDTCHSCQNVLETIQEVLADNAILSAYGLQDENVLRSIQRTPCEPLVRLLKQEAYGEGELAEALQSSRKREQILEQKHTRWKEVRDGLSRLVIESSSLSGQEQQEKAEEAGRRLGISFPPFREGSFLESLIDFKKEIEAKLVLSPQEVLERRCLALLQAKARLHTKKVIKSNAAADIVGRRFHCPVQPEQFEKYEATEGALPELALRSHVVLKHKEDNSLLVLVQSEVGDPPFYSYVYKDGVLNPKDAQDRTARLFLAFHMLREDPVHAASLLTPAALLPSIAPAKKEEKQHAGEEIAIQEKRWISEEIELLQRIVWLDRPHRMATADSVLAQLRALHVLSQLNKYLPEPDESIQSMVSAKHVMSLLDFLERHHDISVSLEPYEVDGLKQLIPEEEKEKYGAILERLRTAPRSVLSEKKKASPEVAAQEKSGNIPSLNEHQEKALDAVKAAFGRTLEPLAVPSQQKPERAEQVQKEYGLLATACSDYTRRPQKEQDHDSDYEHVLASVHALSAQSHSSLSSVSFNAVLSQIGEIRSKAQEEYEDARLRLIAYCTKTRKGIAATRMHIPSDEQLFILYAQKNLRALQQMNPQLGEEDIAKIEKTLRALLDAKQKMQKAGRVTSEIENLKRKLGKKEELPTLFENVLSMADAKRAYVPEVYPHFQVYEVLTDLYIRAGQVKNLDRIITSDQNILLQMLMGGGKTDILLPLIALTKANGENISSVIVPSANLMEVWLKVQERLGVGFQQLAFLLPELSPAPTLQELSYIEEMLRMVQTGRGCLLYSPDRKHVLMNAYISLWEQKCRPGEHDPDLEKKIQTLSRILKMFYEKESVIGDEIDAVLRTNLQYIISLGEPERFSAREAELVGDLLLFLKNNPPPVLLDFLTREEAVQEGAETGAHIPHLSDALYDREVLPRLVEEAMGKLSREEMDAIRDSHGLVYTYVTRRYATEGDDPPSADVMRCIEKLPKEVRTRLVLLRQTLLYIFPKTLDSHFNAKDGYGVLDSQETPWAIPFEGPGAPAKTQFSTPQEQVARTIQSYIKHGVPLGYVRKILSDPQQAGICQSVFGPEKNPEEIRRQLGADEALFRRFLKTFIYPSVQFHRRSIESNSAKLVASSHDVSGFSGTITSFPGTSIFEEVYPDLDEETRSFFTLCTKKEKGEISVQSIGTNQPLAGTSGNVGRLLRMIKESPDQLALIDCAGWLRGTDIRVFAQRILTERSDLDVVVFLNEKGEKMAFVRGQVEPQSFEGLRVEPHKRFTIYDQLHTVGINIPQDKGAACLMTLGKEMIQRDYQQGIFRMRKILEAQKARLVYDDEGLDALRETIEMEEGKSPDYLDWMRFFITKQTMKRLHENYQSMKQRMECRLENRLLRGIVQLSSDGDMVRAQALFRSSTSNHFFIKEKPLDPWDELGTIPTQISKEARVNKDIDSQKSSFKGAVRGFETVLGGIEEETLDKELKKEVHLDDLPAHLDSHDHLGTENQKRELHAETREALAQEAQAAEAVLSRPAATQQARVEKSVKEGITEQTRALRALDRLVQGTIQLTEGVFARDGRIAEQFQYRLEEVKESERRVLSAFAQHEKIASSRLFEQFVRPEMQTLDRLGSLLERDMRMVLFAQNILEKLPKAAQDHFLPMLLDAIRSQNPEYIDEALFQVFQNMSLERCSDVQGEPLAPFPRSQRALIELQRAAKNPAVQAELKAIQGYEAVLPGVKEEARFLGIKGYLRSGDVARVQEEMRRFLHAHVSTLSMEALEAAMQKCLDHSDSQFLSDELTARYRFLETKKRKEETEQLAQEVADLAQHIKEGEVERKEALRHMQERCKGALEPGEQTSIRQDLERIRRQHAEHEGSVEESARALSALPLPESGSCRSALGKSAAEAAAAGLRSARDHLLQESQKGVVPDVRSFSQRKEEEEVFLQEVEREGIRQEDLLRTERKVSQKIAQGCRKEKEEYEAARLSLQSASLPEEGEERRAFAKTLQERNERLLEKEKALNEAAKAEIGAALQTAHQRSSPEVQARLSSEMERFSSAQRDEKTSFEEIERKSDLIREEREKTESLLTQCQAFIRTIEEHKSDAGICTQILYRYAEKRARGITQALQKEASDLSGLQKALRSLQEEVEQASAVEVVDRLEKEVSARKAEGSLAAIEQFEQSIRAFRETLEHTPLRQWGRLLSDEKEHLIAQHEESLFQADVEKMKRAIQADEGIGSVVPLVAALRERAMKFVERKQVVEGIVQDFLGKLFPSSLRDSTLALRVQERLLSASESNQEDVARDAQSTLLLLRQASDTLHTTEESFGSLQKTLDLLLAREAAFDTSVVEQYKSTRTAKQRIVKTAATEAEFRSAMETLASDLSTVQTAVQSQYKELLEGKEKALLESEESRALGTLFQEKPSLHSFFEALERATREYADTEATLANNREKLEKAAQWKAAKEEYDQALDRTLTELSLREIAIALPHVAAGSLSPRGAVLKRLLEERQDALLRDNHGAILTQIRTMEADSLQRLQRLNPLIRQAAIHSVQILQAEAALPESLLQDIQQSPSKESIVTALQQKELAARARLERIKTVEALHERLDSLFPWPLLQTLSIPWESVLESASKGGAELDALVDRTIASHLPRSASREELARFSLTERLKEAFPASYQKLSEEMGERDALLASMNDRLSLFVDTAPEEVARKEVVEGLKLAIQGKTDGAKRAEIRDTLTRVLEAHKKYERDKATCQDELRVLQESLRGKQQNGAETLARETAERIGKEDIQSIKAQITKIRALRTSYDQLAQIQEQFLGASAVQSTTGRSRSELFKSTLESQMRDIKAALDRKEVSDTAALLRTATTLESRLKVMENKIRESEALLKEPLQLMEARYEKTASYNLYDAAFRGAQKKRRMLEEVLKTAPKTVEEMEAYIDLLTRFSSGYADQTTLVSRLQQEYVSSIVGSDMAVLQSALEKQEQVGRALLGRLFSWIGDSMAQRTLRHLLEAGQKEQYERALQEKMSSLTSLPLLIEMAEKKEISEALRHMATARRDLVHALSLEGVHQDVQLLFSSERERLISSLKDPHVAFSETLPAEVRSFREKMQSAQRLFERTEQYRNEWDQKSKQGGAFHALLCERASFEADALEKAVKKESTKEEIDALYDTLMLSHQHTDGMLSEMEQLDTLFQEVQEKADQQSERLTEMRSSIQAFQERIQAQIASSRPSVLSSFQGDVSALTAKVREYKSEYDSVGFSEEVRKLGQTLRTLGKEQVADVCALACPVEAHAHEDPKRKEDLQNVLRDWWSGVCPARFREHPYAQTLSHDLQTVETSNRGERTQELLAGVRVFDEAVHSLGEREAEFVRAEAIERAFNPEGQRINALKTERDALQEKLLHAQEGSAFSACVHEIDGLSHKIEAVVQDIQQEILRQEALKKDFDAVLHAGEEAITQFERLPAFLRKAFAERAQGLSSKKTTLASQEPHISEKAQDATLREEILDFQRAVDSLVDETSRLQSLQSTMPFSQDLIHALPESVWEHALDKRVLDRSIALSLAHCPRKLAIQHTLDHLEEFPETKAVFEQEKAAYESMKDQELSLQSVSLLSASFREKADSFRQSLHRAFEERRPTESVMGEARAFFQKRASTLSTQAELEGACTLLQQQDPLSLLPSFQQELLKRKEIEALQEKVGVLRSQLTDRREALAREQLEDMERELRMSPISSRMEALHAAFKLLESGHIQYGKEKEALLREAESFQGTLPQGVAYVVQRAKRELSPEGNASFVDIRKEIDKAKSLEASYAAFDLLKRGTLAADTPLAQRLCTVRNSVFRDRYRAIEQQLDRGEVIPGAELKKLGEDFAAAKILVQTLQAEEKRSRALLEKKPEQAQSLFGNESDAYQRYQQECSLLSRRCSDLQSIASVPEEIEEQESFVHSFQEACTQVELSQRQVEEKRARYIEDSLFHDVEALGITQTAYRSIEEAEAAHKVRVESALLAHSSPQALEALVEKGHLTPFLRELAAGRDSCLKALYTDALSAKVQARMGAEKTSLEQALRKTAFTETLLRQTKAFRQEADEAQALLEEMETTRIDLQGKKEEARAGSFEQLLYTKAHEEWEEFSLAFEQREHSLASLRSSHRALKEGIPTARSLLQQVERESQALVEESAKSQSTEMGRISEEGRAHLQKLSDDLPTLSLAQWKAVLEPRASAIHDLLEASKKRFLTERYQTIMAEAEERIQRAEEKLDTLSTAIQGSVSRSLARFKRKITITEKLKKAVVDAPDTIRDAMEQLEIDSKEYSRRAQEISAFNETLKGAFTKELLALMPTKSWDSILSDLASADAVLAHLLGRFSRAEDREAIAAQTLSDRLKESFPLCHDVIFEETRQMSAYRQNKDTVGLVRALGAKFESCTQEAGERLDVAFELRQDLKVPLVQLKARCEALIPTLTLAELEAASEKLNKHDALGLKESYLQELHERQSLQRSLERKRDGILDTSPEESARKSSLISLLSELSESSNKESRIRLQQQSDRLWSAHEEYLQAKAVLVQDLERIKASVQETPDFTHVHDLLAETESDLSSLGLDGIRERIEEAEEFKGRYKTLFDKKVTIPIRESFKSDYGKKASDVYSEHLESRFQEVKKSLDRGVKADAASFGQEVGEAHALLLSMDSLGEEVEKALLVEEFSSSILGKKGPFYEQLDRAVSSFNEYKSRLRDRLKLSRQIARHTNEVEQLRSALTQFRAAEEEAKSKRLVYINSTVQEVMDLLHAEESVRPQADTLHDCETALTRLIDTELLKRNKPEPLESIAQDARAVDYLKNQAALRAQCLRLIDQEGDHVLPKRLLDQRSALLQELTVHPASQTIQERSSDFRKEAEEVKRFLQEYSTAKGDLESSIQRSAQGSFLRCLFERASQDLLLLHKGVQEGAFSAPVAQKQVHPILSSVGRHETQAASVDALRISIEQLPGAPSSAVRGFIEEFHQALDGLQGVLSKTPLGEWDATHLYTQFQDMKALKEEIIFKAYLDELQVVMDAIGSEKSDQRRAEDIFRKTAALLAQPGGDGQRLARVRAFVEKWWKECSKSFHEVVRQGAYAGDISAKITGLTTESMRSFYVELREGYNHLHEASGALKQADTKKAAFQEARETIEARREALGLVLPEDEMHARYERLIERLHQEKGASFVRTTAELAQWKEAIDPAIHSLVQDVHTQIQQKAEEFVLPRDTFALLQILYDKQQQGTALQSHYQETVRMKSALAAPTLSEMLDRSIEWIAKEKELMAFGIQLWNACDAVVASVEASNTDEWVSMPSLQEKVRELHTHIATWKNGQASPQQRARAYQQITSMKTTMEEMSAFQRETDRIYETHIQRHLIGLPRSTAESIRSTWDAVIREKNKTDTSRSVSEVLTNLEVDKPFMRNLFDYLDECRPLAATLNRYASLTSFQGIEEPFQAQRARLASMQNELAGELIEKIRSLQTKQPVVANQSIRSRARHLITEVFPKLFERLDIVGSCQTSELSAKLISLLNTGGMEGVSFTGFCQAAHSIQQIRAKAKAAEGSVLAQEIHDVCNELEVVISRQTRVSLYSEKIHDISMTLSSLDATQRQTINRMLQSEKEMEAWALEQTGHNAEQVQANRFSFRDYLMHESGLRRTITLTAQLCVRDVERKVSEHIAVMQESMKHTLKQRFTSLHLSGKLIETRNRHLAALESDFRQPLSVEGFQRKYDHWVRMHDLLVQGRQSQ